MARLLTLSQDEDDEVDSVREKDKPSDEDVSEEDEDVFFTGCTVCEVDDVAIDGPCIVGSQAFKTEGFYHSFWMSGSARRVFWLSRSEDRRQL